MSKDQANTGPAFGKRHLQSFYLLLMVTIGSSIGVNLTDALEGIEESACENENIPSCTLVNESIVLSSFYWGCIILQIYAGELGIKYGPKWLLVGAMFVTSTACILIPPSAAQFGSTGVIICRVIQGLANGFFFPSIHNLLGHWVPASERSRLILLAYSGTPFSSIITKIVASYVSESWGGWPTIFYIFGSLGYVWIIPWIYLGSNTPAEHGTITDEERNYIEKSLGVKEKNRVTSTPWKAIFTSLPVWAIVIAYLGQTWGASVLLNEVPKYLNGVMKYDLKSHRFLSVLPNIAVFVLQFSFSFTADYIINKLGVPRTIARKLFTTIGMTVPLIGLIPQAFIPEQTIILSIILLLIAVSSSAATCAGSFANIMDLSPTFSGIIMGITNSTANLFSIGTPFVVHLIVRDEEDKDLWRTIFIIASCLYSAANIFYIVFASGHVQWWHLANENSNMKNDNLPEKSKVEFNNNSICDII